MANLGKPFDPNEKEPAKAFDILPTAWYAMQIVDSENREAKTEGHAYLWLELEMIEAVHPELKGRKVWARLNLWNSNQQAVDIAERELTAICHAVGHLTAVTDTDVLHGKPMAVKVKAVPAKGEYDASNDVKGYEAYAARFGAGVPVPVSTGATGTGKAPPAGTPPGAAAGGKMPWQQ